MSTSFYQITLLDINDITLYISCGLEFLRHSLRELKTPLADLKPSYEPKRKNIVMNSTPPSDNNNERLPTVLECWVKANGETVHRVTDGMRCEANRRNATIIGVCLCVALIAAGVIYTWSYIFWGVTLTILLACLIICPILLASAWRTIPTYQRFKADTYRLMQLSPVTADLSSDMALAWATDESMQSVCRRLDDKLVYQLDVKEELNRPIKDRGMFKSTIARAREVFEPFGIRGALWYHHFSNYRNYMLVK